MSKTLRRRRENIINLIVIFSLLAIAFGCFCNPDKNGGKRVDIDTSNSPLSNRGGKSSKRGDTKAPTTSKKSTEADNGDFQVEYVDVSNAQYQKINDELRKEKVLELAAKDLNNALSLPHDITLVTKDCNQVNAFYNPNDRSVTMCYELLDHFYKIFKAAGRSEQEATTDMFDAAQFVFLHEIGHALVDAYDLPVVGKEEDAADGLSTFVNLIELKNGARSLIAAADLFNMQSKMAGDKKLPFYDEHSLDQQRFYNLICFLYGSDSGKYGGLVSKGLLPEPRAVRCPAEFNQLKQSWTNLLSKYRKQ